MVKAPYVRSAVARGAVKAVRFVEALHVQTGLRSCRPQAEEAWKLNNITIYKICFYPSYNQL